MSARKGCHFCNYLTMNWKLETKPLQSPGHFVRFKDQLASERHIATLEALKAEMRYIKEFGIAILLRPSDGYDHETVAQVDLPFENELGKFFYSSRS
jgi:hypothetical protein